MIKMKNTRRLAIGLMACALLAASACSRAENDTEEATPEEVWESAKLIVELDPIQAALSGLYFGMPSESLLSSRPEISANGAQLPDGAGSYIRQRWDPSMEVYTGPSSLTEYSSVLYYGVKEGRLAAAMVSAEMQEGIDEARAEAFYSGLLSQLLSHYGAFTRKLEDDGSFEGYVWEALGYGGVQYAVCLYCEPSARAAYIGIFEAQSAWEVGSKQNPSVEFDASFESGRANVVGKVIAEGADSIEAEIKVYEEGGGEGATYGFEKATSNGSELEYGSLSDEAFGKAGSTYRFSITGEAISGAAAYPFEKTIEVKCDSEAKKEPAKAAEADKEEEEEEGDEAPIDEEAGFAVTFNQSILSRIGQPLSEAAASETDMAYILEYSAFPGKAGVNAFGRPLAGYAYAVATGAADATSLEGNAQRTVIAVTGSISAVAYGIFEDTQLDKVLTAVGTSYAECVNDPADPRNGQASFQLKSGGNTYTVTVTLAEGSLVVRPSSQVWISLADSGF